MATADKEYGIFQTPGVEHQTVPTQPIQLEYFGEVEETTEEDGTPIEFYSKSRRLRLVRKPTVTTQNVAGQTQVVERGTDYDFAEDGRVTVKVGQDRLATGPDGEEECAVQWLRRHPRRNILFWEEGREPDRPKPSDAEVLREVVAATAELDFEPVQARLDAERATHNRESLTAACEAALEEIFAARKRLEGQRADDEQVAPNPG